jgi:hypothetical protein
MRIHHHLTLAALMSIGLVAPLQAEGAKIALFDRLTGTWDVTYEIYAKDGTIHPYHGQVIYSRVLNGTGLQEIWTSDIHNKTPQPYGMTLGFFDSNREHWTAVYVFPAKGYTSTVRGGEVEGRIVLKGRDEDGTLQRWSIDNIQTDSFLYRFESSKDEGKTWQLLGLNRMHRHGA